MSVNSAWWSPVSWHGWQLESEPPSKLLYIYAHGTGSCFVPATSMSTQEETDSPPRAVPWFFHDSDAQLDDPNAPLPMPAVSVSATGLLTFPEEATAVAAAAAGTRGSAAKAINEDKNVADDEKASTSEADLRNKPKFTVTSAYVGSVSPNTHWYAFNPSDNKHIEHEYQKDHDSKRPVLVGLNRLFQASLDTKTLRPTYWAPVGTTPNIHRAEWFYSSTLTPISPELEGLVTNAWNQIKPWSASYISELASALDVPEAIDKFRLPITLQEGGKEAKYFLVFAPCLSQERLEDSADAMSALLAEVQSEELKEKLEKVIEKPAADKSPETPRTPTSKRSMDLKSPQSDTEKSPSRAEHGPVSPYMKYPVAYLFSLPTINIPYITGIPTTAQLIQALLNGKSPGGVVFKLQRHFEWSEYKKVKGFSRVRPTDDPDFEPVPIKELVLVFHGIGQKLSERMESFNFTFAINSFRILVNEQLDQGGVKQYVDDHEPGSVMVLPINWRRTVDFEELKKSKNDSGGAADRRFSLADITMKSIPAIRNLISDVMLDIPYYMSRYKPYLVEAAASEANRVYQLFMRNNPDFDGGVNVIGHSLGSLICTDILSNQPTDVYETSTPRLAPSMTRESAMVSIDSKFDFNTRNSFFVGSPAGFFLLMEGNQLYPRELLDKQADKKTYSYGCLAVDNLYNVLHHSDPIAYLLNPTVDVHLATNIWETANLPSEKAFPDPEKTTATSTSFFDSVVAKLPSFNRQLAVENKAAEEIAAEVIHAVEQHSPEATVRTTTEDSLAYSGVEEEDIPAVDLGDVVELQDHDFKRETAGEDRMYMLNDNGQIDWVIPLTGTLENQYVSMITAHSGYWDNRDFARLVAIECTRKPGRDSAIDQFKVQKKAL